MTDNSKFNSPPVVLTCPWCRMDVVFRLRLTDVQMVQDASPRTRRARRRLDDDNGVMGLEAEVLKQLFLEALVDARGNRTHVSKMLGVAHRTVLLRLKRYGWEHLDFTDGIPVECRDRQFDRRVERIRGRNGDGLEVNAECGG